ncbi:tRNA-splicing endonuclease subunit [Xylographa pallens]|nr:tRNA-splicing endonuclease subunit [Xylographa pallens]
MFFTLQSYGTHNEPGEAVRSSNVVHKEGLKPYTLGGESEQNLMTVRVEVPPPVLPFSIFRISSTIDRYLLYDINVITWLRKTHHILGVLVGTLPQIPQQNVFLGLPLELMPEEARLLCENGLALIVDDLEWHQQGMRSLTLEQRNTFVRGLAREGGDASKAAERRKLESTELAMKRLRIGNTPDRESTSSPIDNEDSLADAEAADTLFSSSTQRNVRPPSPSTPLKDSLLKERWSITPTTAHPPLPTPSISTGCPLPNIKTSRYALFRHLHTHDYYISPGLRFGCQFLVYPGDPLRFHSHFLAVSMDWDEEIDLLDLVGGGRLGTGVKKGWLIGGPEKRIDSKSVFTTEHVDDEISEGSMSSRDRDNTDGPAEPGENGSAAGVRTFCIEWGGM